MMNFMLGYSLDKIIKEVKKIFGEDKSLTDKVNNKQREAFIEFIFGQSLKECFQSESQNKYRLEYVSAATPVFGRKHNNQTMIMDKTFEIISSESMLSNRLDIIETSLRNSSDITESNLKFIINDFLKPAFFAGAMYKTRSGKREELHEIKRNFMNKYNLSVDSGRDYEEDYRRFISVTCSEEEAGMILNGLPLNIVQEWENRIDELDEECQDENLGGVYLERYDMLDERARLLEAEENDDTDYLLDGILETIKSELSELQIRKEMQVYYTKYGMLDMIQNDDSVYKVSILYIEKSIFSEYQEKTGCHIPYVDENDNIAILFRGVIEYDSYVKVSNPDYEDIDDFILANNTNYKVYMYNEEECHVYVYREKFLFEVNQGIELQYNAEEPFSNCGKKFVEMIKGEDNIYRGFGCLCMLCACGSSIRQGIECIFPDSNWLDELVANFDKREYENCIDIVLFQKHNVDLGLKDTALSFLYYILGELLQYMTDEEKSRLGLKEKTNIRMFTDYFENYEQSSKSCDPIIKNCAYWDRYIGICAYKLACYENSKIRKDISGLKKYLNVAVNNDYLPAHILKGKLYERGIYGNSSKDRFRAFSEYLAASNKEGYNFAAYFLMQLKKEGLLEDFAEWWRETSNKKEKNPVHLMEKYKSGSNEYMYKMLLEEEMQKQKILLNQTVHNYMRDIDKFALEGKEKKSHLNIDQYVFFGTNEKNRIYINSIPQSDKVEKIYVTQHNNDRVEYANIRKIFPGVQIKNSSIDTIMRTMLNPYNVVEIINLYESNDIKAYMEDNIGCCHFVVLLDDNKENEIIVSQIVKQTQKYQLFFDTILLERNIIVDFRLSDYVDIVCELESNSAAIDIDNLQKDICIQESKKDSGNSGFKLINREFYIPIRTYSYNDEVSKQLLRETPLFLPQIMGKDRETKVNIVIVGDNDCIIDIVKNIMSVGVFGEGSKVLGGSKSAPNSALEKNIEKYLFTQVPSVTIISNRGHELENKFFYDCPEALRGSQYGIIKPDFYEINLSGAAFASLFLQDESGVLSVQENMEMKEIKRKLKGANYYICAMNDGAESNMLAKRIREFDLGMRADYSFQPIIAAFSPEKKVDDENRVISPWYKDHKIIPFGMYESIYSYANLSDNLYYKLALKIHCSYDKRCRENVDILEQSKHSFYTSVYNRDSSVMTSIYYLYRLYSASCLEALGQYEWKKGENYFEWGAKRFIDKISNNNALKYYLAVQEHIRWCAYIVSRGWRSASKVQMESYLKENCTSHKLEIAKLHPYLAPWSKLGDRTNKYEISEGVKSFIQDVLDGKNDKDSNTLKSLIESKFVSYFSAVYGTKENDIISEFNDFLDVSRYLTEEYRKHIDMAKEKNSNEGVSTVLSDKVLQIESNILKLLEVMGNVTEKIKHRIMNSDRAVKTVVKERRIIKEYRQELSLYRNLISDYREGYNALLSKKKEEVPENQNHINLFRARISNKPLSDLLNYAIKFDDLIGSYLEDIIPSGTEGVQRDVDLLMVKYLDDKLFDISIKDTNIQMIEDLLEVLRDFIKTNEKELQEDQARS